MKQTDIIFEPRYEVEISRAGEYLDNTYFGQSRARKPTLTRRRIGIKILVVKGSSRAKVSTGPTYIYNCPYCTKDFRKKTHNAVIRAHKDKNGNN
jgi:hypothetical protein